MTSKHHLSCPTIADLVSRWPVMWSIEVPDVGRLTCYGAPRCIVHVMDYDDEATNFDVYMPPVSRDLDDVTAAIIERATTDPVRTPDIIPTPDLFKRCRPEEIPVGRGDTILIARSLPWTGKSPMEASWERFFRLLEPSTNRPRKGLTRDYHDLLAYLVELVGLGTKDDTLIEHELVDDAGFDTPLGRAVFVMRERVKDVG